MSAGCHSPRVDGSRISRLSPGVTRPAFTGQPLAQAAEYTNTTAPFGQLLVLDLTEKKVGTLRVDELTWLAKHRPPNALIDRAVVAAVVTGNRYTPSDFSA
ncbi:hypothetical protein [Streptomyces sp. NPDC088757]|uniref:hypothetical protein n=1 Tax=Streptomyces sp. NPDC088757 TaxID=3365889 RepID=UPI0037F584CD